MRNLRVFLTAALAFTALAAVAQNSQEDRNTKVVRQFLAAFNAHDPAAMAELVADDIKWLSVNGSTLTVELEGKAGFVEAMREYFDGCPSCQSEIRSLMSSGERVSAVEVASWMGSNGQNAQQSMAVYEFSGSRIRAVYYFPEEAVPDDDDSTAQPGETAVGS